MHLSPNIMQALSYEKSRYTGAGFDVEHSHHIRRGISAALEVYSNESFQHRRIHGATRTDDSWRRLCSAPRFGQRRRNPNPHSDTDSCRPAGSSTLNTRQRCRNHRTIRISWSAVTDPSGIVAYNWQVSPSSTFSPVIEQSSTNGQTQDTVSGLANGTYFWRVQAVNGNFVQGAWSAAQSFSVTGANSGELGSPTLNPPHNATAFHPMEVIYFDWSAVPGATTYIFDASTDPSFPIATELHINNIPNTSYSLQMGDSIPQGTWYVRVSAVNANLIAGVPSNSVTFVLSFNAPLPPAPTLLSPANGSSVTLPVTLTWTDVPNPQPSGYVLEIAADPNFTNIQYTDNQITGAHWAVTSLPSGTKYWHVLSTQGDSAPDVPANTAWSATGTFVVPSTPPTVGSLTAATTSPSNGATEVMFLQLNTPAQAGGAVVTLTSSDPAAAPIQSSYAMPEGFAWAEFQFTIGSVATQTPVTLTASVNGTSTSTTIVVQPPTLQSLTFSFPAVGGYAMSGLAQLSGAAPSNGMVVSLSSSDPAVASVPATVVAQSGNWFANVNVATSPVQASTVVTISASLNGTTVQGRLTVAPGQAHELVTLNPSTTTGTAGSSGLVRLDNAVSNDTTFTLTSSNPAVASVPASVVISQFTSGASFNVVTSAVTQATNVTITASGGGLTQSAVLTVMPATPAASLSAITLNPTSTRGGNDVTGTATLSSPAPSGGVVVTLTSSNSSLASVPTSVTVPAGATSASFSIRTHSVSNTSSVTIGGSGGGASQSRVLTLTH